MISDSIRKQVLAYAKAYFLCRKSNGNIQEVTELTNNQLRNIRLYLNLSQKQMADLLGISRPYLSMIETGEKPISERVNMQLAKHVQTTPEFLEAVERYKSFHGGEDDA